MTMPHDKVQWNLKTGLFQNEILLHNSDKMSQNYKQSGGL